MKPCCCCCSKNINNPENKEPSKLDSEIPETGFKNNQINLKQI